MLEYGDLIIRYLERLGVEYVFGVPGGSIEPFTMRLLAAKNVAVSKPSSPDMKRAQLSWQRGMLGKQVD